MLTSRSSYGLNMIELQNAYFDVLQRKYRFPAKLNGRENFSGKTIDKVYIGGPFDLLIRRTINKLLSEHFF